MAALVKAVQVSRSVNNITRLFTNLSLASNVVASLPQHVFLRVHSTPALHCAFVHISPKYHDLMEFFDEPKLWGKNEVRVGRSWKKEELRLKSNSDLHKLWFVLLKERNMLMTMEEACKDAYQIFPNPERLDKVQDSMDNLESIVRERNRAYHMLETGETGEQPGKMAYNCLGIKSYHKMYQYQVPKFMNKRWHKWHFFGFKERSVRKFQLLYKEKIWNTKRRARNRDRNHVASLFRKFPNLDLEAVKEQYPTVDIEKTKQSKRARSHYVL